MRNDHYNFTAQDGTRLFVYRWRPDVGIGKGIVHIAHGLAEHGGRYEEFAEALTDEGYIVCANDHRGHGRTAQSQNDLGFFSDKDGWELAISDLAAICRAEKADHPGLPFILFGHSMGSTMVQQMLYRHGGMLNAAALSACTGEAGPLVHLGRLIARFERLRSGARGRSDLINRLSFDSFNESFKPNRTSFDWLSRDESEVDRYIADPNCGFTATNQLWVDLLDATVEIARPENHRDIPRELPVYLFTGSDDPVNNNGRGCVSLYESWRQSGLKNISYRIYPNARHESLHELNRNEVIRNFIEWLECLRALTRA
ncbi:MAG: alpha/beta fold hydrolase [Blastocatellales bacterium]